MNHETSLTNSSTAFRQMKNSFFSFLSHTFHDDIAAIELQFFIHDVKHNKKCAAKAKNDDERAWKINVEHANRFSFSFFFVCVSSLNDLII